MKDVPNDADVKIFKVAKRGPVSDIAIIDASNNNEVIPFDKPFDIYGWKNNTDTIYKVTLSPLTSNITLKLTGKIGDLKLANGNDLKEGENTIELESGAFKKTLKATTSCGNTAKVVIEFNYFGPISCISVSDPMEDKNINVTIVDPVFFDKENVRLNA